jgi:hypothetical protein
MLVHLGPKSIRFIYNQSKVCVAEQTEEIFRVVPENRLLSSISITPMNPELALDPFWLLASRFQYHILLICDLRISHTSNKPDTEVGRSMSRKNEQTKGDRLLFRGAIPRGAVIEPFHKENPARAAELAGPCPVEVQSNWITKVDEPLSAPQPASIRESVNRKDLLGKRIGRRE